MCRADGNVVIVNLADHIYPLYKKGGNLIPVFPQRMRRDMGMRFFAIVSSL